ncbi:MAG: DUF1841 family protein [Oxalobacteraceae bacterium]|nr:DUF1841 family protein [Oxalobacteraceae bacterium]
MFNPSREEVRRFFCDTWHKTKHGSPLTELEAIARDWLLQHPEYDSQLSDPETAQAKDFDIAQGQSNPFLHLSMHLSIAEQISIDQPSGVRDAFHQLAARLGEHEAHHQIMECLGEMLWTSQRNGMPPDGESYIDCIRRRMR